MTDDVLEVKLARIVELLERIVSIQEELVNPVAAPSGCPHERVTDLSTMGQPPGSRVLCQICGELLVRVMEGD